MGVWVKAVDLLEDPTQREKMERWFIRYVPDVGTMSFPADKTGIDESDKRLYGLKVNGVQETGTKVDLGWHLARTNREQLIAVAHNVTEFKLILRGKTGWENSANLLQEYGTKCYSSSKLQARGMCLTKERYEDLSPWLKATTKESYLLAEKDVGKSGSEPLSVLRVDEGDVGNHILYFGELMQHVVCLALRPCVYLSLDTLLYMEDKEYNGYTPRRAIKLKLPTSAPEGIIGLGYMW